MCLSAKNNLHHHWFAVVAFIAALLFRTEVQAQDIHFSQFYTSKLVTNPANTGMSGQNLQVANNYRNQWSKIGIPYKTISTSVDKKIYISGNLVGVGALIVHDQSSALKLAANEFFLSVSYSKIVNNHQFTFGLQPGYVFKSYNLNGLTFGSQFDQSSQQYNPSLSSSEDALNSSLHHFDLNAGISWRTLIRKVMPMAGISFSHILKPVESFSTSSSGTRLPMRITFNTQIMVPVNDRFDMIPSLLYSSTLGASELVMGSIEGYSLNNFVIPIKRVYAITMFRVNPTSNIDALIFGGGIQFAKFDLGISYDFNISPLAQSASYNGAFEVSLIFTGKYTPKKITEPCYIY
jgi:type IX secretion system PorP/SprF family membrane protein